MATKKSGKGGFMQWYESYQGKTIVNIVYSVGAAVVIVGALFKILHLPGARELLMVGMLTEAFLFTIGALDKPHPEFHWDNVFPQLLGYGTDPKLLAEKAKQPRPTLLGGGAVEGAAPVAGAPVAANVPAMSAEDAKAFAGSMEELAKTAGQFATAGAAAEKFAASAEAIEANMKAAAEGAKAYQENIVAAGAQMSSLNSLYELQVKNAQAQAEAMTAFSESSKKLSEQVASLNSVYGNMLNALA